MVVFAFAHNHLFYKKDVAIISRHHNYSLFIINYSLISLDQVRRRSTGRNAIYGAPPSCRRVPNRIYLWRLLHSRCNWGRIGMPEGLLAKSSFDIFL